MLTVAPLLLCCCAVGADDCQQGGAGSSTEEREFPRGNRLNLAWTRGGRRRDRRCLDSVVSAWPWLGVVDVMWMEMR